MRFLKRFSLIKLVLCAIAFAALAAPLAGAEEKPEVNRLPPVEDSAELEKRSDQKADSDSEEDAINGAGLLTQVRGSDGETTIEYSRFERDVDLR